MYDKIEINFLSFIKKESQGIFSQLLKLFLIFISKIYSLIVFLRNKAYDYNLLKSYKLDVPVISVGNIVVGGTGKTPVTLMLSKELSDLAPLAILSRGYRSPAEKMEHPLLLCNGDGPNYPVELCGDEPFLLAENLKKTLIIVGKSRKNAAKIAISHNAKLIILDDGMQHRQLARTADIIVMDASDPFGRNSLLPAGLLREHVSSLKRAHLIILNHVNNQSHYETAVQEIVKITNSPIIGTQIKVTSIKDINNNEEIDIKGKKVGYFCSLGNPFHFEETLKNLEITIIDSLKFRDHGKINEIDLRNFAETCKKKNAEYLICSEKDKVKLNASSSFDLSIVWIKIELNIIEGLSNWNNFIESTRKLVRTQETK